jgi:uncharacterized repeat protein (TIGR03803 family)
MHPRSFPFALLAATVLSSCGRADVNSAVPAAQPIDSSLRVSSNQREPSVASEKVLYAFPGGLGGSHSDGNLRAAQGTLYGTTQGGGCCGTIFAISPASGQERTLYRFQGAPDGMRPNDLVGVNRVLYGTTIGGGSGKCPCGTVFAINPSTGRERAVYSFQGSPDGEGPSGNLIAVNGVLYGVTITGGNSGCYTGCGTVFAFNLKSRRETVLYRFHGGTDGFEPIGGLLAVNGTLYGTTFRGGTPGSGSCDCGTLFSVDLASHKETVLYRFGPNARWPAASLVELNGALYGVAGGGVAGTLFTFNLASKQESILHSFQGGPSDGTDPMGIVSLNGLLYGTTNLGGSCRNSGYGCGTVFSVNPSSGHETILYSFAGGRDGERPYAGLLAYNGILYGTTDRGGHSCREQTGCGTVFSVTR